MKCQGVSLKESFPHMEKSSQGSREYYLVKSKIIPGRGFEGNPGESFKESREELWKESWKDTLRKARKKKQKKIAEETNAGVPGGVPERNPEENLKKLVYAS